MASSEREERFNRIVAEHADALHRYLRRRYAAADAADAEDLLADVLSVAWKKIDSIPADAEAPWLYGVARKRVANAQRRRQRRDRITTASLRPAAPSSAAEEQFVAQDALRAALASLGDKDREVLMLSAWEGLGPEELAVALGVSQNAAAVRLSKAKTKLLAALNEPESQTVVATPALVRGREGTE